MENKKLFGLMSYIHREMSRENGALLAEFGLSPVQLHAMAFVIKNQKAGKSICQKDIEKELNLRASSVSSLLVQLEKNGFIIRNVSEGDARSKNIGLTEKGRNLCLRSKKFIDECDGLIQSALTEEEQETLKNLFVKILEKIENHEKEVKA